MSMPGAEGIGGGSPEWRASADQAPVSLGYVSDMYPFADKDAAEIGQLTDALPESLGGKLPDAVPQEK